MPERVAFYVGPKTVFTNTSIRFGVLRAVNKGAKVINISIGGPAYADAVVTRVPISNIINDAINTAVDDGVTVVVAAGNQDDDTENYVPSNCNAAIVVGAIDNEYVRWVEEDDEPKGSNTGSTLDFVAPGRSVKLCNKDGTEDKASGTSYAAPHIAAAAAMIKLLHPNYSPAKIEEALVECSVDLGDPLEYGYGMPDLSRIAGGGTDPGVGPEPHDNDIANGTCGTCSWRINSGGCLIVGPGTLPDYEDLPEAESPGGYKWPWSPYRKDITSVQFSSKTKTGEDASMMFIGCNYLTNVTSLSNLDTSNATKMYAMFAGCNSLTSIQSLSRWDVSNVSNMVSMFENCHSLTSVKPLSDWSVSNVHGMDAMFSNCRSLASVEPLSEWNVSNVTSMSAMFYGCQSLASVRPLAGWNVSGVEYMDSMFSKCESLVDLNGLAMWNVSQAREMGGMFAWCTSLTSADGISSWDVSNAYTEGMFEGCDNLTSFPSWYTE